MYAWFHEMMLLIIIIIITACNDEGYIEWRKSDVEGRLVVGGHARYSMCGVMKIDMTNDFLEWKSVYVCVCVCLSRWQGALSSFTSCYHTCIRES